MKKIKLLFVPLLLIFIFGFIGCSNDDNIGIDDSMVNDVYLSGGGSQPTTGNYGEPIDIPDDNIPLKK